MSEPINGWGFQNDSYIYFRDSISFDYVEQVASTNSTYGDWVFFKKTGESNIYGFYSTGVNVTVNSYFASSILELACVGAGTVKVQVSSLGEPTGVTAASAIYDKTNAIALLTVTSSSTVQVNWNPTTVAGDSTSTSTSSSTSTTPTLAPNYTPNTSPSGSDAFRVNNLNLGKISSNSTVIVPLSFTYSGSNIYLQSISFPEPFNGWYIQNANFTSLTYLNSGTGANAGSVNLVFNTDSLLQSSYSGTFTVKCVDAFGATLTSTATISAGNSEVKEQFFLLTVWQEHPLYIIAAIAVLIAVAVIVLLSRRKR